MDIIVLQITENYNYTYYSLKFKPMKTLAKISEGTKKWKVNVYVLQNFDELYFDLDYKSIKKSGLDVIGKVIVETDSIWSTSKVAVEHVIKRAEDALIEKGIMNVYNRICN